VNSRLRVPGPTATAIERHGTIIMRPPRPGIGGPKPPEPAVVPEEINRSAFQDRVLAHLDAGYNLALWMLRDEHLAADALQDAALKAWSRFESFHGGDSKSWLLAIVRTSVVDLVRRTRRSESIPLEATNEPPGQESSQASPLSSLLRREHAGMIHDVVWTLPDAMREILVLREIEDLSYAQIAQVLDVPIGTVMSRVSRARDAAAAALRAQLTKERTDGV
jgi:RNA polymerase sigma factor (sigma-70 family)